jgi:hypothetical protein
MTWSPVQSNAGFSNSSQAAASTLSSPSTPGNLIVLGFVSDDTFTAHPAAGWTESAGSPQVTDGVLYFWWKISAGEQSVTYSTNISDTSAWVMAELSGNVASPFDTASGVNANTNGNAISYATPSITPAAGSPLLLALVGGTVNAPSSNVLPYTWSAGFTRINDSLSTATSGINSDLGMAYLTPAADGSTAYTSTATFGGGPNNVWTGGYIISFKSAVPVIIPAIAAFGPEPIGILA